MSVACGGTCEPLISACDRPHDFYSHLSTLLYSLYEYIIYMCACESYLHHHLQESPDFSGSEATQLLVNNVRTFTSSLAKPCNESSGPVKQQQHQQLQQPQSKVHRGGDPSSGEASQPLLSTAALGVSDSQDKWSQNKTLLTGMAATSPASSAHSGPSMRRKAMGAVIAPQPSQPSASSKHPQATAETVTDRLQPSGASQSSNALNRDNGCTQAEASPSSPAGPPRGGDPAAGSTPGIAHSVGRVGVESLGGLAWQLEGSDAEVENHIYVAVFQLKAMIRESRCAAMLSFPAGMFSPIMYVHMSMVTHYVSSAMYR